MKDYAALATELADPKYAAMTDAEAVTELHKGTTQIGRIEGENKLNLIAYEAEQDLLYTAEQAAADTNNPDAVRKLARALAKNVNPLLIASSIWRINLADAKVQAMFQGCVAAGLLTNDQKIALEAMATYEVPSQWANYTEKDVYIARNSLAGTGTISTNYSAGLSYLVNTDTTKISVIVYLDQPAVHDVNGTLQFLVANERQTEDNSYAEFPAKYSFKIKKGQSAVPLKMSGSDLTRFIRAKVELDTNLTATVEVRGV